MKLTTDSDRTDRLGRILQLFRDDKDIKGSDLNLLYDKVLVANMKTFRDFEDIITPFLA